MKICLCACWKFSYGRSQMTQFNLTQNELSAWKCIFENKNSSPRQIDDSWNVWIMNYVLNTVFMKIYNSGTKFWFFLDFDKNENHWIRRVIKLILTRWRSQPITARLLSISLKSYLSGKNASQVECGTFACRNSSSAMIHRNLIFCSKIAAF